MVLLQLWLRCAYIAIRDLWELNQINPISYIWYDSPGMY